ncbi:MAG: Re/Si-specific NAD(P)(+) transhydrogenase subunit alpha [Candidatus Nucleicultricaceae bacterium]
MKIAILKDKAAHEKRVAATPETVKKYNALGFDVVIEKSAGESASISDEQYKSAGATIVANAKEALKGAQLVLRIQRPGLGGDDEKEILSAIEEKAILVSLFSPYTFLDHAAAFKAKKLTCVSLELVPRITRAQSMDVLSSQANLAGYRSVIESAALLDRAFPMMMTAAGTIPPARVLIMGAGVAGLQAIATARRLGAIVSAFDVRAAAKEQVESLGATFVSVDTVESGEGGGGYAKEMSKEYQKAQALKIEQEIEKNDIVITTALIPGKPAPQLITEAMVKKMKPGSVILDMAVESGGNCAASKLNEIVSVNGVRIIGYPNLPSRIARDASALFARNIYSLVDLIVSKGEKKVELNFEDEIISSSTLMHQGELVHPLFKTKGE